jgi:hypothetical protein
MARFVTIADNGATADVVTPTSASACAGLSTRRCGAIGARGTGSRPPPVIPREAICRPLAAGRDARWCRPWPRELIVDFRSLLLHFHLRHRRKWDGEFESPLLHRDSFSPVPTRDPAQNPAPWRRSATFDGAIPGIRMLVVYDGAAWCSRWQHAKTRVCRPRPFFGTSTQSPMTILIVMARSGWQARTPIMACEQRGSMLPLSLDPQWPSE